MNPGPPRGPVDPGESVLICCWSLKGGSGVTVIAAALAIAASADEAALAVDLGGDLPTVLGLPDPAGAGVLDWLAASSDVGAVALHRIEAEASPTLGLIPCGRGQPRADRWGELVDALDDDGRNVVVDAGTWPVSPELLGGCDASLLVVRTCYLALRRAASLPVRPSGIVLVSEQGRALGRIDAEHIVGSPVVAEVPVVGAVGRAVDSGLFNTRMPSVLAMDHLFARLSFSSPRPWWFR